MNVEPYLPTEDVRKLHSEVNQIVNQRFLICTAAVAIFGVIEAWSFPRRIPLTPEDITRACLTCVLVQILLTGLYLKGHILRLKLLTFVTYLRITKSSVWESDWHEFKNSKRSRYSFLDARAHTLTFVMIGALAYVFPVVFALWAAQEASHLGYLMMLLILTMFYVTGISVVGFGGFGYPEKDVEGRWREALKDNHRYQDIIASPTIIPVPVQLRPSEPHDHGANRSSATSRKEDKEEVA